MKYRIGHLAYATTDMEKTLSFYTKLLGFRHFHSIPRDGKPWIEYLVTPDGRFVELFYPEQKGTPELGKSYMHLCLEVEDLAAAVEELRAQGVEITSEMRTGKDGTSQAWIKDPDGRAIELMHLSDTCAQTQARNALK